MSDIKYDFIGGDGKQYGPFTLDELRDCIHQRRATPESKVRETGEHSNEWRSIREVLNLQPGSTLSPIESTTVTDHYLDFDQFREAVLASNNRLDVGLALGQGWTLFTAHMGILVGACLLYMLILVGAGFIPFSSLILQGPLTGGLFILVLNLIRTNTATIGDLFQGFARNFGWLLLISIVQIVVVCVAIFIGAIPLTLIIGIFAGGIGAVLESPGIFVIAMICAGIFAMIIMAIIAGVLTFFPLPLAADKKLDFSQAFSLGWPVSKSNFVPILMLFGLLSFVNIIATVLCMLPLIFSIPWSYAVICQAYEQMFNPQ